MEVPPLNSLTAANSKHGKENETKAESRTSLIPSQPQLPAILRLPELHVILFLIALSEIFFHGCFIETV